MDNFSLDIEKNAYLAVRKIESKIPVEGVDIVFYHNPAGVIPELGIGGHSANANTIFISLDPKFKNFRQTIDFQIERILAHELHHCLRWRKVGYGKTLLEALITEGLADHFEIEVTGKSTQPWDRALDDKQIEKYLDLAKPEFNHKNYDRHAWFFGSQTRRLPRWTGYTLGFHLVGKYLKNNPSKRPSDLYATAAREILRYGEI